MRIHIRTAEELKLAGETEISLLLAMELHDRVVSAYKESIGVADWSASRQALAAELSIIKGGQ